jgi:hypothetical protein
MEPCDPADPCEPREDDRPRDIGPDAAWDPVEPCETRGAMGLASSASQPSVAAAMVLSYLITRGSKNRKNRGALLPRRHHFEITSRRAARHGYDDDADIGGGVDEPPGGGGSTRAGAAVLVVVLVAARGRQVPRGPRRCRGDEDDITAVSEKIRAGPRVVP